MAEFLALVPAGLVQGCILALVALGIFIPFRILNFADLTGEGSYPLGGAVCASLLILGVHPGIALGIGAMAGGLLGVFTAVAHIRLGVNTLLAGIILSTMAWSVNLRLMGAPNLALFDQLTIFSSVGGQGGTVLVLLGLVSVCTGAFFIFLHTGKGLRLRAQGANAAFAARQGVNGHLYTALGLGLGNALIGLAGALMVQLQGYMDISMGLGMVIHALAALMIGEGLLGQRSLMLQLLAPFLGALLYQQIQGGVLSLGLAPSDLKFVTGALTLVLFGISTPQRGRS